MLIQLLISKKFQSIIPYNQTSVFCWAEIALEYVHFCQSHKVKDPFYYELN